MTRMRSKQRRSSGMENKEVGWAKNARVHGGEVRQGREGTAKETAKGKEGCAGGDDGAAARKCEGGGDDGGMR